MQASQVKVGILMGGKSSEHDVSLMSGNEVFQNIDIHKYHPNKLLINKDGSMDFTLEKLKSMDIIFIAIHGFGGEDGRIQGFLETLGVAYTGPNLLSSAIAMDKYLTKEIWKHLNLPIIPHKLVRSVEECQNASLPFVLKPRTQGSSVGVSIVKNVGAIEAAFENAKHPVDEVMLEEYISGSEITVGVLGKEINKLEALPVIEIKPEHEFYDYHSKYFSDLTEYRMPPKNVSEDVCKKAQEISIKACEVLGIHSFARVDLLVKDGQPLLMEINTIPGLTKHSLLPKAAQQAGLSFTDLLDRMIQLGLSRRKPYIEDLYANLS